MNRVLQKVRILEYKYQRKRKNSIENKLLVIELIKYENRLVKIDIREYYFDKQDEMFKPSKTGIDLFIETAEALFNCLNINEESINAFLSNENQFDSSRINSISNESEFNSRYELYKIKFESDSASISYSKSHPFIKILNEDNLDVVNKIFVSFEEVLSNIEGSSKILAGDLITDLKQSWNIQLKKKVT